MKHRQKILVVSAGDFRSEYGGGQIYVRTIVDELINRGEDIVIAVRDDGCQPFTVSEYRNVKVVNYSLAGPGDTRATILSLLDKVKPEVVHAHADKALFADACASLGIPSVITAHHGGLLCPAGTLMNYRDEICRIQCAPRVCLPCVLKSLRWGILAWFPLQLIPWPVQISAGKILRRKKFIPYFTPVGTVALHIQEKAAEWATIRKTAGTLISPSKAMADSMLRNGAERRRIRIVPHGIIPPGKRASGGVPEGRPLRFYFVGRICYVKGLHVMIEAFRALDRKDVELHIVGEASRKAEVRYYRRLKKLSGEDERIFWHGKVEHKELGELTAQFDIMIHPAIFLEVFGLTIAEAMSLGKPVISTRCGGAEDQIVDGVNGVLVAPNDAGSLRAGMMRLIEDEKLRKHIADNAPNSVNLLTSHVDELMKCYSAATIIQPDENNHGNR